MVFLGGVAVGDDACAAAHENAPVLLESQPNGDAGIHVAGEVHVTDRASVHPALAVFEIVDDLAGADLRRAAQGACRQHALYRIESIAFIADLSADGAADVHDVAELEHLMERLHLNGAELRYTTQIVSSQINQHVVLGQLLFIAKKTRLELRVFFRRFPSRASACQREGVEHAAFQLDQGLGACACKLDIVAGEIEHVRTRVTCAQISIGVEQAAAVVGIEAVGQNHLEDVAFPDVLLSLGNDIRVLVVREEPSELARATAVRFVDGSAAQDEIHHPAKLGLGGIVFVLEVIDGHLLDEHDLLAIVVEGDHLIEEHKVDVVEALIVFRVEVKRRLRVFQVVIGKVSDKPSSERRQGRIAIRLVRREGAPKVEGRVAPTKLDAVGVHHAIARRDLHDRIVAKERVTPPLLGGFRRFKQVYMTRHAFEYAEHLYWSADIRVDLGCQGDTAQGAIRSGDAPHFLQAPVQRKHSAHLSGAIKNAPDSLSVKDEFPRGATLFRS